MLLMVAMALMTGAAAFAVLWPLGRNRPPETSDRGADVAFYEDQIAEIGRDVERGLISAGDADAARAEAGRRLLRARSVGPGPGSTTGEPALRRRRGASALTLSAIPLISLAVYGVLGSPHLPAEDASARAAAMQTTGDLATALAGIEAHLAAMPNDGRGWDVVAPVYLRAGRFGDAVAAFRSARRILGDSAPRLGGLGEALVGRDGGTVPPEAVAVLERALELDPSAPAPRFYLARAAEQAGDETKARESYARMVATAPPGAVWLPEVTGRLSRLEGTRGATPMAALPDGVAGPDIMAMVGGLDARLAASGGSEAEWSRLVRSYVVLGRPDEALDRLARARLALTREDGAGARLDALARDLGLAERRASR